MNVKALYLETFSDTIDAGGVVVVADIVILPGKFYVVNPFVSRGLTLCMFPRIWSIMKKAITY